LENLVLCAHILLGSRPSIITHAYKMEVRYIIYTSILIVLNVAEFEVLVHSRIIGNSMKFRCGKGPKLTFIFAESAWGLSSVNEIYIQDAPQRDIHSWM